MKFKEFFNTMSSSDVDSSQIENFYDKAKIAVALVKKYHPELLEKISVIANLPSGAYGVYTHFEVENKPNASGITFNKNNVNLNELPEQLLKKHYPNIRKDQFDKGDIIKINIQRILNDPRIDTDFETVKQIAAVIVHECTHKKEVDETGKTNEIGPKNAERQFLDFLNKPEVSKEIVQELLKYPSGSKTVGKLF